MTPTMGPTQEERRLLTLLFADLSGFTGLSSKLDPEEVREVANLCFEHLNKAIIGQGGTIHKYEGDMVMALFGLPSSHEDDPERAIRASFAMFELLPEVNRALTARLKKSTDLGLHVGINSGTVVVGEIGSAEKREYTVMGDAVNLASRLKDLAGRGEIVVSEAVFRASRYLFEYEPREPVAVKGFSEPVKVFRPLKERAKPEPKRGIQGLAAPMVGRDRELGELKHRVEALSEGKGGAVFVFGEAGLGKSRLLEELKRWVVQESLSVSLFEGRCLASCENIPYWPFLMVLRSVFGITDLDSREEVGDKILKKGKAVFPEGWQEVVPYLGYLFSVRFEGALEEKVKYLDSKDLKAQILVSTRRLFREIARKEPLLLVIEDYHWVDFESLEVLEFLFEAPEPFPMLLIVLSRMEKEKEGHKARERLRSKLGSDFQEMVLEPLSQGAGTRLIYSFLKNPGFSEEFKDQLLAKAAGNPFYLEEILRSLIDSGILICREGNWVLTREVDAFAIPDNVQAVIAARLDNLEKDVRDVLQTATVIGRSFPVSILQPLSQVDELMLTLYLAVLEEHEYISERKLDAGREYAFRHPLLLEVAYNGLLKKRRRELHRRAGEVIENLFPDRLEDFTELLANQYASGDDPRKALEWLRKAGMKAKDRYANDEAIGYFRQVVSLLERNGDGRADDLCDAYQALGDIHRLKGEYGMTLSCFDSVIRHAGDGEIRQAKARVQIAEIHSIQARFEEALRVLEEAEGLLPGKTSEERVEKADIFIVRSRIYEGMEVNDKARDAVRMGLEILAEERAGGSFPDEARVSQLTAKGYNSMGITSTNAGEWDKALECFQEFLALSERYGSKGEVCTGLNNIGTVYHHKGDLENAIVYFERSRAIAEEIGRRSTQARAYNNLGLMHRRQGHFDLALELIRRALGIHEEQGDKQSACVLTRNVGLVYLDQGEYAQARRFFAEALDRAEAIGYRHGIAGAEGDLGSVLVAVGELREAEAHLQRAVEFAREIGDKENLLEIFNELANLKTQQTEPGGPPSSEALAYMDQAFRLAEGLKYPIFQADCHQTYARIYSRAGEFQRSEDYFRKVLPVYESLFEKQVLADTCLDYARMLNEAAAKGVALQGRAEEYFAKARALYQDLKLPHKVAECQ